MDTRVITSSVHGIDMSFKDLKTSGTIDCVFTELRRNDYGLESISLQPDDLVIDVGANVGMFSVYVKKKYGCKIIAFEPVPINFLHLQENIILNGLSLTDFELHNVAISAMDNSYVEIGTPEYNTGGSSVFHTGSMLSRCRTQSLRTYLDKPCTYLKIDTEGAEYDIVPSVLDLLNNTKYLGIEFHRFRQDQNPKDLYCLIKQHFNGIIFTEKEKDYLL